MQTEPAIDTTTEPTAPEPTLAPSVAATPATEPATTIPPVAPTATVPDFPDGVHLKRKTGLQRIRKKIQTVNLPFYDIWIDDALVGQVGIKPGVPVTINREVTDDEVEEIKTAVAAHKGEPRESIVVKQAPSLPGK